MFECCIIRTDSKDYDCATTDNKEGKMLTLTSSPCVTKGYLDNLPSCTLRGATT